MNCITAWVQRRRDRASAAKNRRLRVQQLKREWADLDRRHNVALQEHKLACERYQANPTSENRDATWRYYERTWDLLTSGGLPISS